MKYKYYIDIDNTLLRLNTENNLFYFLSTNPINRGQWLTTDYNERIDKPLSLNNIMLIIDKSGEDTVIPYIKDFLMQEATNECT